jgi:hypothetical protein
MITGVSSFELLTAELLEHYDVTNIQIYSVNRIVGETVAIDIRVPCLLFDLGRYALPAVGEAPTALLRPKLTNLANRLRAIYPLDYPVFLMHIATDACRSVRTNPIELEAALTKFQGGAPSFSPPSPRQQRPEGHFEIDKGRL